MASPHPQFQGTGSAGYYNQHQHQQHQQSQTPYQNPQLNPQYAYPQQVPPYLPHQHYAYQRQQPHSAANGNAAPASPRPGHMNGASSGRGGYGRGGNPAYFPPQPQHQHIQHHPHHPPPPHQQHYVPSPQIHAPQPTHHLPHKYMPVVQAPYSPSHAYPYPAYPPPPQTWSPQVHGHLQTHQHLPPPPRQDLSPLSPSVKLKITTPGDVDASQVYTPPSTRVEDTEQLIDPESITQQSLQPENEVQTQEVVSFPEPEHQLEPGKVDSFDKIPQSPPAAEQLLEADEPVSTVPNTMPDPIPSKSTVSTTFSVNDPSSIMITTNDGNETTPGVSAGTPKWAIWSRRPGDPRQAPGIIISPRARPPPHIVASALSTETPPPSPPPTPPAPEVVEKEIPKEPELKKEDSLSTSASSDPVPSVESETASESIASSLTSVSAVTTSKSDVAESSVPATPVPVPEVKLPTTTSVPPPTPGPSSAPPPPVPSSSVATPTPGPAVKKSWASLLKPNGPSSTPAKGSLPTSQVIGFSIPAVPAAPPGLPISAAQRTALLRLLTGQGAPAPTGQTAGVSPQAKPKGGVVSNNKPKPPASVVSSQSVFDEAPPKIRARGLINSGNSCYANAVLQALVFCPPFWALFTSIGKILYGDGPSSASTVKEGALGAPLVEATVRLVREFVDDKTKGWGAFGPGMKEVKGKGKAKEVSIDIGEGEEEWEGIDSFVPMYVYDALKEKKRFDHMRGGHQEDAEEFLGFFLDTLEEELIGIVQALSPSTASTASAAKTDPPAEEIEEEAPVEDGWLEVGKKNRMVVTRTVKSAESPVSKIFGGKFRSTLRAPGQKDSVVVEDWRSLRLDIQRDTITMIQDALLSISQPSAVQIASAARPQTTVNASQQILVEALPPILVLHLKRFLYDAQVGGVVKLARHVRFGPDLEIPSEILVGAAAGSRKGGPGVRYGLLSVVYHHGVSAGGGHYTIDAFKGLQEGWARIDDESVNDVRVEDVFVGEGEERCAYLLFYRRLRS